MTIAKSPTVFETNFSFPFQTGFYRGKVRDVYEIDNKTLVMVASDRISAFDYILPRQIPFKGQVLNQIATKFLRLCSDIVPSWLLDSPDPNVAIGMKCEPIRIEMVIRGYLSGHSWRVYKSGGRMICGVKMPEGLKENDKFPEAILTPASKNSEGHDEDISREEILRQGIIPETDYLKLEDFTRRLFRRGTEYAAKMGLILVDTKYEFGYLNGEIVLMDEIHTPDSSRYFYSEGYEERQQRGEKQRQLSKEFMREWLIENNFQGLEGQKMPEMGDEIVEMVSLRYLELYKKLTGEEISMNLPEDIQKRIEKNVLTYLSQLSHA